MIVDTSWELTAPPLESTKFYSIVLLVSVITEPELNTAPQLFTVLPFITVSIMDKVELVPTEIPPPFLLPAEL